MRRTAPNLLNFASQVDVAGDAFELEVPESAEFARRGRGDEFEGFIDIRRKWGGPGHEEVLVGGFRHVSSIEEASSMCIRYHVVVRRPKCIGRGGGVGVGCHRRPTREWRAMSTGPIVALSTNAAEVVGVVASVSLSPVRDPLFFSPMGGDRPF